MSEIAQIRERWEAVKNKETWALDVMHKFADKDIPALIDEVDRLTIELAAEKRRANAAVKYIPHRCDICVSFANPSEQEPCASCKQHCNFTWCGPDNALKGGR